MITKEAKLNTRKRLGKDASELVLSRNVLNGDGFVGDKGEKLMEKDGDIFGTRKITMIGGEFYAAFVIFKIAEMDVWSSFVNGESFRV